MAVAWVDWVTDGAAAPPLGRSRLSTIRRRCPARSTVFSSLEAIRLTIFVGGVDVRGPRGGVGVGVGHLALGFSLCLAQVRFFLKVESCPRVRARVHRWVSLDVLSKARRSTSHPEWVISHVVLDPHAPDPGDNPRSTGISSPGRSSLPHRSAHALSRGFSRPRPGPRPVPNSSRTAFSITSPRHRSGLHCGHRARLDAAICES